MCGITGLLGGQNRDQDGYTSLLTRMAGTLEHRGPDDSGVWFDSAERVGLGHRRLSVLDLSVAGHQPMESSSGRFVLSYNGEIYNHDSLRAQLHAAGSNPHWRGHSDTEALLAGFETFGVHETLRKSIGMFALAVWDRTTSELILARDRLGEKPLYYGWQGEIADRVFLFGSELKALRSHPAFNTKIDRDAVCLLLKHNYIPAPHSIYCGIAKLEPGCILTVSLQQPEPIITRYWDVMGAVSDGVKHPFSGSLDQAVDTLEDLTKDAIRQQMVADVPLGAFLSGGIDSSTVVALMQSQSSRRVKTFTIGFGEEQFNEALHAKEVAAHLGTDHTEIYVTAEEARRAIPRLPYLYCEPFADPAQIPQFIVSELARSQVTVALSGDGGDELFAGYERYHVTDALWKRVRLLPHPIRSAIASVVGSLSPAHWNKFAPLARTSGRRLSLGEDLHRRAALFRSGTVNELYLGATSQIISPETWVIGGKPDNEPVKQRVSQEDLEAVEHMMALDMIMYLPDDILAKVDRAGMGVSLECRVPFLDHRVVEFAWSLPLKYKTHEGQTKWPLRQVLYRYVPPRLVDRPKMGLGVPINEWLRGPLREWATALLDESKISAQGIFFADVIKEKWAEHLSRQQNWGAQLWSVLMFQAWMEENG